MLRARERSILTFVKVGVARRAARLTEIKAPTGGRSPAARRRLAMYRGHESVASSRSSDHTAMTKPHAANSPDAPPAHAPPTIQDFFSFGFRPFFLAASIWAAAAMTLWLTWIAIHAAGGALTWITIAEAPHVWHAHEMIYGFAIAAVAGFLLTAVPNWTGATPMSGHPLAALFAVWVVGRIAMTASGLLPIALVAIADLAFIPALGAVAARQLLVKPQRKNMVFLALLTLLAACNIAYHLAGAGVIGIDPLAAMRPALMTLVLMVVVIGGRIVPAFTHNWLHLNAPAGPMPRRNAKLDAASVGSVVLVLLVMLLPVGDVWLAAAALIAGLANGARLAGWRGLATRGAPIVMVLHVGYGWVVIGLLALAVASATDALSQAAALHALGAGGIATMILAVMSRASLGHTGRPLVAPRPVASAYWLVSAAAALRAFGPALMPQSYNTIMLTAGALWILAFVAFAIVYAPILTTPRTRQRTTAA